MRELARTLAATALVTLLAAGCSSSSGGGEAGPTGGSGAPTGTSGPTGGSGGGTAPEACVLLTAETVGAYLSGDLEEVADPFADDLIAGVEGDYANTCAYTASGGDTFASLAVYPSNLWLADIAPLVQDGVVHGGPDYIAWDLGGDVVLKKGTVVFAVRIVTSAGSGLDPDAALQLADAAASLLPTPATDEGVLACYLLPEEVAEAGVGGVDLVLDRGAVVDGQRSGCAYTGASEDYRVYLQVTRGNEAEFEFGQRLEAGQNDQGFAAIRGLGDDAFRAGTDVLVLSGDTLLDAIVFGPDGDSDLGLAEELARQVAAQL